MNNSRNNLFKQLSSKELSIVTGGGQPDYNFGYGIGHGIRKATHKIVHWASKNIKKLHW